MIDELLDVARTEAGRPVPLDRRPTDLVALARRGRPGAGGDRGGGRADRHAVRVEAEVPELVGQWDAPRLERVLANLIDNAVNYSPAGGAVTVRVAREAALEVGGGGRADGWAVLAVSDQGIGIPASDLPRVFKRFRRAGNLPDGTRGAGIGPAPGRWSSSTAARSASRARKVRAARSPCGCRSGRPRPSPPELPGGTSEPHR